MAKNVREKNLRSLGEVSKAERSEICRKGGIASGEARRRKADIRKAMNELMSMPAVGRAKELVKDAGYTEDEQVNANAVATKLFQMALGGNQRAMELLIDYFFKASEDDRKAKESQARIDAMKKNMGDLTVNSQDEDDGGVVIYLPEIEKEEEDPEKGEEDATGGD